MATVPKSPHDTTAFGRRSKNKENEETFYLLNKRQLHFSSLVFAFKEYNKYRKCDYCKMNELQSNTWNSILLAYGFFEHDFGVWEKAQFFCSYTWSEEKRRIDLSELTVTNSAVAIKLTSYADPFLRIKSKNDYAQLSGSSSSS